MDSKLILAIYIKESVYLTDRAKVQLLESLNNKESIDEQQTVGYLAQTLGGSAVMAMDVARVGMLITVAYKVYKAFFSKAAKACRTKAGRDKQECIYKYKVAALRQQIKALKKNRAYCKKAKEPEKCRQRIDSEIEKVKQKIKKLKY